MHLERVRPALRERLGHEGTADLVDLLGLCKKEWQADVMSLAAERFERCLSDETSKVRLDMVQGFAGVRQEMATGFAAIRQEMTTGLAAVGQEMVVGFAAVRTEMAEGFSAVRQETTREIAREVGSLRKDMVEGFAGVRQDMAGQRAEMMKWAFLFWIGQFFAVAGLFAAAARYLRVP